MIKKRYIGDDKASIKTCANNLWTYNYYVNYIQHFFLITYKVYLYKHRNSSSIIVA